MDANQSKESFVNNIIFDVKEKIQGMKVEFVESPLARHVVSI